jgi:catechol 2,3-dioxygenase-like lactoylglutathione lyase family enzyme
MPVTLNHTIVHSDDADAGAAFLSEILGVAPPTPFGPFVEVELDGGIRLDYLQTHEPFVQEHYAFLVGEDDFDAIFARITERGLTYWADPHEHEPDAINHHDGGRGVYWRSPEGHKLEIITRPYGSGT